MIYLDNAATSFPKPPAVAKAMAGVLTHIGGNPGRAGHRLSLAGGRVIENCREMFCRAFGMSAPERVVFTHSCTESLNLAIRGMLYEGDEVLVSHAEHNAVMRVLKAYEACGAISVRVLTPDGRGIVTRQALECAISPKTALCVLCHASNVTGVIQPVKELSESLKKRGIPLLVDAAQTGGVLDVSPTVLGADMVAMAGHKGLLGPHGTGLLLLGDDCTPRPLIFGGTGTRSDSMMQPDDPPDRYESGTLDLPGIAGLRVGAQFALRHREEIEQYEEYLSHRLRTGLQNISGVRVLGAEHCRRVGVVSFLVDGFDLGDVADRLDKAGFALRSGLHCAPSIHSWLGTLSSGACRASVGIYNTEEDIDQFLMALSRLIREG